MPDPFESLRLPTVPVDPDPAFVRRLRRQVERGLQLPRGAVMSDLEVDVELDSPVEPGVVPYLIVDDAPRALDWYEAALGARRRGVPIVMDDGRIGHAELELRGSVFFLADESPDSPVAAPRRGDRATVSLVVDVDAVDAAVRRAVQAGADLERAPANYPHGRNAVIRDPFGHRWMLSSAPTETTTDVGAVIAPGHVGYASLWVPDVERAASFFHQVLGWSYAPGSGPQGRQVEGVVPHHGLWGEQPRSTLFCCFRVEDVDAAVARVRAAGGTAEEPTVQPYGRVAGCVDDQGTRFAVYEPPGGESDARVAGAPHPGELVYVTLEVRDTATARAFYGPVLGWRFSPGRVEDGWGVDGALIGLHGGHDEATGVPLYRVDDVDAAVERVRAAGGTASPPETQPYGRVANCVDDQGTRFSVGQL